MIGLDDTHVPKKHQKRDQNHSITVICEDCYVSIDKMNTEKCYENKTTSAQKQFHKKAELSLQTIETCPGLSPAKKRCLMYCNLRRCIIKFENV